MLWIHSLAVALRPSHYRVRGCGDEIGQTEARVGGRHTPQCGTIARCVQLALVDYTLRAQTPTYNTIITSFYSDFNQNWLIQVDTQLAKPDLWNTGQCVWCHYSLTV